VTVGLLWAAGAALCYGFASVLQAVSAARTTAATGLDPRLLLRLTRQLPYVAGLGQDAVGFGFNVLALRTLPLFFVQSVVAGSVGVTAVTATFVFGTRLRRGEVVALGALVVGLVLLSVAAEPGAATPLSRVGSWLLLGSAGLVAVAAAVVARWRQGTAVALAVLAGAGFAGVGIAARGLPTPRPLWHVVAEPAAWALIAFGALAMLLFATALQRGPVTVVSAVMFAVETVVPAVVGLIFLGDATRPVIGPPVAAAGFTLTLAAAVALTPYAEPGAQAPPSTR
jgi:drug/metabolite transporter (DMT)-like permease